MRKALLWFVALPYTQEVLDLIHILAIANIDYTPLEGKTAKDCGLFIYYSGLGLEEIDYADEWLIEDKDALNILILYANKDFEGICAYLNNIPERPFNVCVNSTYLPN